MDILQNALNSNANNSIDGLDEIDWYYIISNVEALKTIRSNYCMCAYAPSRHNKFMGENQQNGGRERVNSPKTISI